MSQRFGEQIMAAIDQLGAEEAASRMARALVALAHSSGTDIEFSCDLGEVAVKRITIPEDVKH